MTDEEPLSPAAMEKLHAAVSKVPFARLLGIELVAARKGTATLSIKITESLKQIHGVMHGGAIASLVDTATAFAIVPLVDEDEKFTTVDLTISYLRPLTNGTAIAEARVIHAGRRLVTVTAEVKDPVGKLAATALSTYLRFR